MWKVAWKKGGKEDEGGYVEDISVEVTHKKKNGVGKRENDGMPNDNEENGKCEKGGVEGQMEKKNMNGNKSKSEEDEEEQEEEDDEEG